MGPFRGPAIRSSAQGRLSVWVRQQARQATIAPANSDSRYPCLSFGSFLLPFRHDLAPVRNIKTRDVGRNFLHQGKMWPRMVLRLSLDILSSQVKGCDAFDEDVKCTVQPLRRSFTLPYDYRDLSSSPNALRLFYNYTPDTGNHVRFVFS